MTLDTAKKLVKRCRYKPGWTLSASYSPVGADLVRLEARSTFPDADAQQPTATLEFFEDVQLAQQQPVGLLFALLRLLEMAERHELREWFTFDGAKLSDPHLPGGL